MVARATLTADGRGPAARRRAVARRGAQRASRPARARGRRIVGKARPAAIVVARRAPADRALAKLTAGASHTARPAVVLIAREDDARLTRAAAAKLLTRRARAFAALADLTWKATIAASPAVAAVGRRIDAHQRRSAHHAGGHGCAGDAFAAHAGGSAGARHTAPAAVAVVGGRVNANRRATGTAHELACGASAGAVLTIPAGGTGAAASTAVGVVVRQVSARRVDAGAA